MAKNQVSAMALWQLLDISASLGQYCKGYVNSQLEYTPGFYCDHYCCGSVSHKFCCLNAEFSVANLQASGGIDATGQYAPGMGGSIAKSENM